MRCSGPLHSGLAPAISRPLTAGVRQQENENTPIPRSLEPELQGKRVVIVNDVINAGSAVRGTLASLKRCGAQAVAIGALAIYGDAAGELAATHHLSLETLASFPSPMWEPSVCPLCAKGVPLSAASWSPAHSVE